MPISSSTYTSSFAPEASSSRRLSRLSTHTPSRARFESAARRASFGAPTTSLETSTSSMPPSTIASASETFWQQTPIAPAATWRFAISGHLWVLAWARTRTSWPRREFPRVLRFFSKLSRSTSSAGVSTSSSRWPTEAGARMLGRRCLSRALLQREPGDRGRHPRHQRQREQVDALPADGRHRHARSERGNSHHGEDRLVVGSLGLRALLRAIGLREQRRAADVEEVPAHPEQHQRPPELRHRDAGERDADRR